MNTSKTNNLFEYKGYYGSIEFDLESKSLYGQLLGIKGAYIYEGNTLEELEADFKQFVDDYIHDCKEDGIKPQKPNLGSLNIRLKPDIYLRAVRNAKRKGISLNRYINTAVECLVEED
ncbi:MAG: type II toxin-antitoxin system HicB family antitoxin [Paludibacteraceae bacterium]|jgi:predicted HicB family RNase H-like nuclease